MEDSEISLNDLDEEVLAFLATYEPELEENLKFGYDDPSEQLYKLKLKLGPQCAAENKKFIDIFATVVINIYKGYPTRKAIVSFENYGNILPEIQSKILKNVNECCRSYASNNIGSIFAICTCVQEILTNITDVKLAEMEEKMNQIDKQKKKQKEYEERNKRIFFEKRKSVDLAIKEEAKQRKEQIKERSVSLSSESSDTSEICRSKMDQSLESSKLEEKLIPVAFKCKQGMGNICEPILPLAIDLCINIIYQRSNIRGKIILDNLLKKNPERYQHVFLGHDTDTKSKLIVYKWAIHINSKRQDNDKVIRFLCSMKILEPEANLLIKLQHDNVVSFKGMVLIRNRDRCINLFLLYDFLIGGLPISYHLENEISQTEILLRHISEGVLAALEYLHGRDVIHRNITPSNIFLDRFSKNVMLSDTGLKIRCNEAVSEYYDFDIPKVYSTYPGKSKKTADIHRLGLVLLQSFNARKGKQVFSKPSGNITEKLSSFLKCCMEKPHSERWMANELLMHKFITDDNNSSTAYGIDGNGMPWVPENLKSESRLYNDYDILYTLGKGGFGAVYKVQSKVDGNYYALKIVKIKDEDLIDSRKMILEVKLLSSLNHENVVRYYTSWKETLSEMLTITPTEENAEDRAKSSHKLTIEDSSSTEVNSDTDDDYSSHMSNDFLVDDSDDDDNSIIFEDASNRDDDTITDAKYVPMAKCKVKEAELLFAYLYIQMEFCEKCTLRQAIDKSKGPIEDNRLWRYFREMVNGLNYIHIKGLIHRDLKPGNIFIDSNDQVKIGDFGLATAIVDRNPPLQESTSRSKGKKNSAFLTGKVGTTFYIAPELKSSDLKVKYSNKVDIYSLGIIFFEMIYSFQTGMERAKVLSDLKLDEKHYPSDYHVVVNETKKELVKMLLNKDPSKRPTTRELLNSQLLPALPAEQQKFITMIKESIAKEGCARYQNMLQLIFDQDANRNIDATFDAVHQRKLTQQQLKDVSIIYCSLIDIFRNHGGIWIPTPFFLPKGAGSVDSMRSVDLLTKDGDLLVSQFELRYPFARFLAKSDFKRLRRFYIDKVQRSIQTPSVHPRESYDCAFDIVDNQINLVESMVRLFLIAQEILLQVCGYGIDEITIKLSHTDLVKLLLSQAYIEKECHQRVFALLNDLQRKIYGFDEDSFLNCIKEITKGKFCLETLKYILPISGPVDLVISEIKTRNLSSLNQQEKNIFRKVCFQLENLVTCAREMGIKFAFILEPLMVADKGLYDGIVFQLQTVRGTGKDPYIMILSKGGSYYHLVLHHRQKTYIKSSVDENLCAVGITLSLPVLYRSVSLNNSKKCFAKFNSIDVLVCSIEERQIERRMKFVNMLRNLGLSVEHCYMENKNEASPYYNNMRNVDNFLCLDSEDEDKYTVRAVEMDDSQPKVSVKYLSFDEVFEYFTKIAHPYQSSELSSSKIVKSNLQKYQLIIEYICRKPLRDKEDKVKQKISEDVETYISSKFGSYSIPGPVNVIAVDFDKNLVASLRELDPDSTLKNFNDTVSDLKNNCREADFKECIDKIGKYCIKNIFHSKKQDKSFIILIYSIPSEYLRRIY